MKTLVIANQKGGVAKTTTAVNLAAYLGLLDKKVLLVDLDPQGNATSGIGIDRKTVDKSVYDVMIGREPAEQVVRVSTTRGVSVLPADLSLVGAEVELVNADRREVRLSEGLTRNEFNKKFDFIIIDTPPSLGLLTLNAMTAAHSVLIPMQCEYFALEGLAQLYKTIQLVRKNTNPDLYIEGLLFSMVDMRSNLTLQVMEEVKKILKEKVYETVIPRNVRLAEAPSFGKSILGYDKHSKGAEAYQKLAKEFLKRNEELPILPDLTSPDQETPDSDPTPQGGETANTPEEVST